MNIGRKIIEVQWKEEANGGLATTEDQETRRMHLDLDTV